MLKMEISFLSPVGLKEKIRSESPDPDTWKLVVGGYCSARLTPAMTSPALRLALGPNSTSGQPSLVAPTSCQGCFLLLEMPFSPKPPHPRSLSPTLAAGLALKWFNY
ncbi:unnamed protein product [Prunus armeniaca]